MDSGLLVISLLTDMVVLAIAATAYIQNFRSFIVRDLAGFLFFLAIWTLSINLAGCDFAAGAALWLVRLSFAAMAAASATLFAFAHTLSQKLFPSRTRILLAIMTALIVGFAFSPYIVSGVVVASGKVTPIRTFGYLIFVAVFLTMNLYAISLIVKHWKAQKLKKSRRQTGIIVFGLGFGTAIAIVTNVLLPNSTGSIQPARYSLIALIIWLITLLYVVVRHGFLDIKLTAVRSITYILTIGFLALLYYGLAYLVSTVFFYVHTDAEISFGFVNIALAVILALLFQPLKKVFDTLTNAVFYHSDYETQEMLDKVGAAASRNNYVEPLLKDALSILRQSIKPSEAHFVLVNDVGKVVHTQSFGSQESYDTLIAHLIRCKKRLITTRTVLPETWASLGAEMDRRELMVAIRLDTTLGVGGFLLLGEKLSGGMYTRKDTDFLSVMADELAIAVENARRYEEIQAFNETLQNKVEDATYELKATNKKLRVMDQTKDEFISLTSHQLRTPLTTIKGYLSMLLEGDAGQLTEQQSKLVEEAFNSSQRMAHLISDFLNISRIQTGKFVIELTNVNLADILDEEIDQLRISANSRNLTLAYDKPVNFPTMPVDEGKIRQVMMNFIDNAIYYSPGDTTITIVLTYTASSVEFKVIDQGIGVPKAEQHKLFNKFSRASNAKKQRPDGTGIGLFMAKKVIVALGGAIIFKSEEGKGSTFGFHLNR